MPKSCSSAVAMAAFAAVYDHHKARLAVCIGSPANVGECQTTGAKMVAMTDTLATTIFTFADVGTGGRSMEIAAQTNMTCSATGTVDHVALFTSGASGVVYYVTTCTSQLVASTANKINLSTFKITIGEVT